MAEEPELQIARNPEEMSLIEQARRVGYLIGEAEHRLGINNDHLPLSARLQMVLQGAMDNPGAVDPTTFSLVYRLNEADQPLSLA